MTFDEWLESYFSGTQIDDVVTGMMRTAFEAGRCEAGTVGLHDKFAMAALTGLLSNSGGVIQHNSLSGTGYANCSHDDVAAWAYDLADAMLKERRECPIT